MAPLKKAAVYFFSAYFFVQLAGHNFAPNKEYFPVFSWSLFSVVSNDVRDVTIEVTKVGDKEYRPPVNYYELGDDFVAAKNRDSGVLKAARRLVSTNPDDAAYEERESEFVASFFGVEPDIEFRLVGLRFDPLERWHTGKVADRVLISTHSTRK